ncbi:MAG: hypothetical protein LBS89_05620 [Zoogloeaceae bacterium]|jgi:hypothetical protein|nr:hypothetical protein [Zoogloeaceae bacterium]
MKNQNLLQVASVLFWAVIFSVAMPVRAQAGFELNHVTSVQVNGLDAFDAVTMSQWLKVFGTKGVTQSIFLNECTVNYEVEVRYPDRTIRLEFFSEDNPNIDLEKIFAAKDDRYRKHPIKARLWINWDNMAKFKDSLRVDGHLIRPNLTFAEFQKMFPLSAKQQSTGFAASEGAQIYALIAGGQTAEEAAYGGVLLFEVKNGKLFKLAIWQGVAC